MKLKKYSSSIILVLILGTVAAQTDHGTMNHSQHDQSHTTEEADFAERERAVMPFDLGATLHVFEDTATGGVQRVVANDAGDSENIALIRSHLKEEAKMFAQGQFSDPSYLHGEAMPGLADLEAAGEQGLLEVSYSNLDDGGQITYSSEDPTVVIALHLWFQAQVVDHGEHATD